MYEKWKLGTFYGSFYSINSSSQRQAAAADVNILRHMLSISELLTLGAEEKTRENERANKVKKLEKV